MVQLIILTTRESLDQLNIEKEIYKGINPLIEIKGVASVDGKRH